MALLYQAEAWLSSEAPSDHYLAIYAFGRTLHPGAGPAGDQVMCGAHSELEAALEHARCPIQSWQCMGMLSSPCSAVVMPRDRIGGLPKERCLGYCSVPDAVRSASEVALGEECGDARLGRRMYLW